MEEHRKEKLTDIECQKSVVSEVAPHSEPNEAARRVLALDAFEHHTTVLEVGAILSGVD